MIRKMIATLWRRLSPGKLSAANVAEGTHADGQLTKVLDAAVTDRYLLGKIGDSATDIDICGASDKPLAIIEDEGDAGDYATCAVLGVASGTRRMVAAEVIAQGDELYTAANGQVQNEPAVAGTYYWVGKALTAAAAQADEIEVAHRHPTAFVVPE